MIDENSMAPYENKVRRNLLTNAGRQIFLEASNGLGTVVYTRATLSSQQLVDISSNELDNNTVREINDLADNLKEGQIRLGKIADDHFDVIADFDNENQFTDISFNTVGWYARLDTVGSDGGTTRGDEVLMVITEMTDQPTTLPACSTDGLSTQSISIDLNMAISNATDIQMAAETNDYVTHPEFNVWKTQIAADINAISLDTSADQVRENTTHIQEVQGAGQYTQIYLTDQDGSCITNELGASIVGNKWLPMVDKALTQSDLPADAKAVGDAINQAAAFNPEKYGIPVLYLWSDQIETLTDKTITLKNEVTYKFPHFNIQGTLKELQINGQSSAYLPKKNYWITFDQNFAAFPSYGKQHKYVIKAFYTDASKVLDTVNTKLWGKIRKTHIEASDRLQDNHGNYLVDNHGNNITAETDPQLAVGGNCGTGDGFPIAISINNKYWGLYSFSIPEGAWMAKMPSKVGYATADTIWWPQGALQKETNLKDQMILDFCGTEDIQWAINSMNKLIDAVMADYDKAEDFDKAVSPLIDLDSAYDYYIYSVLVNNNDGICRNYLLQTFDGKKWYFVAFDLDQTFGRAPGVMDHTLANSDTGDWREHGVTFENVTGDNRLMYQLWKFHKAEVLSRAKDLINGVMSAPAVDTAFIDYERNMPQIALDEETKVWPGTPNTSVDNVNRMGRWYMQRIEWFKKRYLDSQSSELEQLKAKVANLEHITAGK